MPLTILSSGWNVILALLGFTFVIFIHELGHFLFAKWAGVRVERFSIGFGPLIWNRRLGETDYAVSLLPLGGYVKMLGEEDGDEGKYDPRSFANATKSWRMLILLGGVLFNLLSSYAILLSLAWYGMPLIPAVVGGVHDRMITYGGDDVESPASQLGLRQGDRIREINGEKIHSIEDVIYTVMTHGTRPIQLKIERRGESEPLIVPRDGKAITPIYSLEEGRPSLGIEFPLGCRIAQVASKETLGPNDPQPGERLVAINGDALGKDLVGQQVEERLLRYLGKNVSLTLAHKGSTRDLEIPYAGGNAHGPRLVGFPVRIMRVISDSPAKENGLLPGDVVTAVNDEPIRSAAQLLAMVSGLADSDQAIRLGYLRDGAEHQVTMHARENAGRKIIGVGPEMIFLAGTLSYLPPGLNGALNPLAEAGVKVGDAVIDLEDDPAAPGKRQLVTVISGGTSTVIPLPEKLPKDANLHRLFGKKIAAIKHTEQSTALELIDSEQKSALINLDKLEPDLRSLIARSVQVGDWIVGWSVQADGQRAIELRRGAEGSPRIYPLDLRQPGVAITFGVEEQPEQAKDFKDAFDLANNVAYNAIWRTLQIIPRFFQKATAGGISSSKSLSGPIGIFTAIKASYEHLGFASFLKLIAVIGLNLFLVNLLPIPVVDGGQLMFLAIEAVLRRPVPGLVKTVASAIGLMIIVSLMLYVVSLDVLRLFGWL